MYSTSIFKANISMYSFFVMLFVTLVCCSPLRVPDDKLLREPRLFEYSIIADPETVWKATHQIMLNDGWQIIEELPEQKYLCLRKEEFDREQKSFFAYMNIWVRQNNSKTFLRMRTVYQKPKIFYGPEKDGSYVWVTLQSYQPIINKIEEVCNLFKKTKGI